MIFVARKMAQWLYDLYRPLADMEIATWEMVSTTPYPEGECLVVTPRSRLRSHAS